MIPIKTNLTGYILNRLTEKEINNIINEISKHKKDLTKDFAWLLAFQYDGVIWGRAEQDAWILSGDVFPEISPTFNKEALLELRIFNRDKEILLWKSENGFKARELVHNYHSDEKDNNPLRPSFDKYLIRGDRVLKIKNGFSLLKDKTGTRQAIPIECSNDNFKKHHPFLEICHYFEIDDKSAMVRITASRLVDIRINKGGS